MYDMCFGRLSNDFSAFVLVSKEDRGQVLPLLSKLDWRKRGGGGGDVLGFVSVLTYVIDRETECKWNLNTVRRSSWIYIKVLWNPKQDQTVPRLLHSFVKCMCNPASKRRREPLNLVPYMLHLNWDLSNILVLTRLYVLTCKRPILKTCLYELWIVPIFSLQLSNGVKLRVHGLDLQQAPFFGRCGLSGWNIFASRPDGLGSHVVDLRTEIVLVNNSQSGSACWDSIHSYTLTCRCMQQWWDENGWAEGWIRCLCWNRELNDLLALLVLLR